MFLSCTRRFVCGLVVCVFLCLIASCGRVGSLYIEAPVKKIGVENARLHFFFDKTESMQGFTAKGDDSSYVQTLPLLWKVGNDAFDTSTARFFDYGESYTNEFKSMEAIRYVKNEVLKNGFYGYGSPLTGGVQEKVKDNGGQPFSAIADYIGALNGPGSAYIVVTDFYEQNRESPFFLFFRDAFSHGLSGALFAVESAFSGRIHSFSYVNNVERYIQVRDGISTFFICIVGDSDIVYAYSAALAKELSDQKINFHDSVFLVKATQEAKPHHGDPIMAPDKRRYENKENALRLVNLRQHEVKFANKQTSSDRIEAYQILTETGSRWAAGLPLKNINTDNFNYRAESSLNYFDGKKVKTEGNENPPSEFEGKANSTDASAKLMYISNIEKKSLPEDADSSPLYISIETKNHEMKKGWYKIKYDIVAEAIKRPGWILDLNAENIGTLEQSARVIGGRVKVLELANMYEKITDAYNRQARVIYSDSIYLVKK